MVNGNWGGRTGRNALSASAPMEKGEGRLEESSTNGGRYDTAAIKDSARTRHSYHDQFLVFLALENYQFH